MRPTALCLAFGAGLGAQHIAVRGAQPEVMPVGGDAFVTVVVDAADAAELGALPTVDGLALAAGAPVATRVQTWVDGRLVEQASTAWPIRITAARAGTFTLPPFAAAMRGATLSSAPVSCAAIAAPAGSADAFVELAAERGAYYLHEQILLRVRFGFAQDFAARSLVPMFARPLDVAAQVRASFCAGLPHALLGGEADRGGQRATFVLNEAVANASAQGAIERGGRVFTVYEFTRTLLPTHTGELVVPGPSLRFAYATRFAEDFVDGRVALDRRDGCVHAPSLTLRIDPWPAREQPDDFTGAVGRFTLRAEAQPRELAAGASVKLTLHIAGEGDLRRFAAPRPPLADFHVLGKVEETTATARIITYDLRPLRAGATIPRITFAFFDPAAPAAFRRVASDPIALEVRPAAGESDGAAAAAPRPVPGENDIFDAVSTTLPRHGGARRLPSAAVIGALGAPWLLAGLLALHLRRRERAHRDPLAARARAAAAVFRRQAPDADPTGAFVEFLAARLRCSPPAVISPDLAHRLSDAGVPADLAARTAGTVAQLAAARYGGAHPRGRDAELHALVDALEDAFRAGERA